MVWEELDQINIYIIHCSAFENSHWGLVKSRADGYSKTIIL